MAIGFYTICTILEGFGEISITTQFNIMHKILRYFFVCLIVLEFFRLAIVYDFIPDRLRAGLGYLLLSFIPCLMLSSNLQSIWRSNSTNKFQCNKLLLYYGFFIFLNCITCYFFRAQSVKVTIEAWAPFLIIYLYPIMRTWNLSIQEWQKIIVALFMYYAIGYVLQFVFNETMIMYMSSTWNKFLVDGRIRIYSEGILYLGTIFFWNKYLTNRNTKYLLVFILGIFLIFLTRFRIILVVLPIVLLYIYIKINGFRWKMFSFSIVIVLAINVALHIPVVQEAIDEMIERKESDYFDNEDYVRVLGYEYFTNNHFKSNIEYFLGSGMPVLAVDADKQEVHKTPSQYSKKMSELGAYNHFFTVDWGLLGLSWVAGIPFVLFLILILLKIILTKVSNDYLFLRGYCILVLLIGILNPMVYYHKNIFFLAIILTILDIVKNGSIKQTKYL